MTVLHDMTAAELLAAYKSKKLSPVEATDAVIARIEAWEPKLKALYAPDFEGARRQAKASEKRWHHGQPQGALDGLLRRAARSRGGARRPAVFRARRRADDAHGRGQCAADGRAFQARSSRPYEPAASRQRLERGSARAQGSQDRPASRCRVGPAGRRRGQGGGRGGRQAVR